MFRRAAAVVLVGVAVSGCGGSGGGDAPPGAAPPTSPPSSTAPAATPATSDTTSDTASDMAPAPPPDSTDPPSTLDTTPELPVPPILQFTAPLIGGGEVELATLAGRPVLLWFWSPF